MALILITGGHINTHVLMMEVRADGIWKRSRRILRKCLLKWGRLKTFTVCAQCTIHIMSVILHKMHCGFLPAPSLSCYLSTACVPCTCSHRSAGPAHRLHRLWPCFSGHLLFEASSCLRHMGSCDQQDHQAALWRRGDRVGDEQLHETNTASVTAVSVDGCTQGSRRGSK